MAKGVDSGYPMSPELRPADVLLRYFYDGGTLKQGRLCQLTPADTDTVSGLALLHALHDDGVDLGCFYPCVRETEASGGGWLRFLRGVVGEPPAEVEGDDDITFPLPREASDRRIDVKLFRRERLSADEVRAGQDSAPSGRIARTGYYGVGVVGGKNENNLGTLWRSAFQLDAAFLFTVGGRYKAQATDTVNAASRVPLFELAEWSDFARFAPKGAKWVAIEFGGTPLEDFEHPPNAVYLLGAEDVGLPTAVLRACHETISLSAENYASYNVAVAGSLVMYDRATKSRKKAAAAAAAVAEGGRPAGKGAAWSEAVREGGDEGADGQGQ